MNNDEFFYKNILNAVRCSISTYDIKGKLLYCNDFFRNNYLKDITAIEGLTYSNITNEEYKSISFIPEALNSNEKISRQQPYGSNCFFSVSTFPGIDSKGRKMIIESISPPFTAITSTLKKDLDSISAQKMVIGDNAMKSILETITRISNFDSTILITGESGTGKSMLAKYIHETSKRCNEPFIMINCATIPENLIESELFGYVSGAFTGAQNKGKPGMVELANKGTLFLDEIGLLPLNAQTKFLQLIQEKTYTPIGSLKSKTVDIRIISATNLNLKEQIVASKFREDLYYRLRVIEFYMPPLRERPDAIEPLINYFIGVLNNKYNIKKSISSEAKEILKKYIWLGNIRELQYLVERLIVTSPENLISSRDIPPLLDITTNSSVNGLKESLIFDDEIEAFEKKLLRNALITHKSTYKIAKALGMTQTRVSRLLRKYEIK